MIGERRRRLFRGAERFRRGSEAAILRVRLCRVEEDCNAFVFY